MIGADVLYGAEDKSILPFSIHMSGKVVVSCRKEGFPWTLHLRLDVPGEHLYKRSWDDKPWKPRGRAHGKAKGTIAATSAEEEDLPGPPALSPRTEAHINRAVAPP
jgi:hypothetical protein